jgi:hypothetical protein
MEFDVIVTVQGDVMLVSPVLRTWIIITVVGLRGRGTHAGKRWAGRVGHSG